MAGGRYKPQQVHQMDVPPGLAVTLDPQALDDLIASQGALFEHWQAIRCPVGMVDKYDTVRRAHEHHEGCSNGFIYVKVGEFQALLTGNGINPEFKDQGVLDSSTASMTFPRFYAGDEDKRVYIAPMDRLYYKDEDILVSNWELLEAHATGLDRPSFPAVEVLHIIDSRGIRYGSGDYSLVDGNIKWLGERQPGLDPDTTKGVVYSVRYQYKPFWYISRMGHEVRTVNVDDPITGERRPEKMNQSATVQREFLFLNEERPDPADAASARAFRAPVDGGMGMR